MFDCEYNYFSLNRIRELVQIGREFGAKYSSYEEMLYCHGRDFLFRELEVLALGFDNPEWEVPDARTYLRIGEPAIDCYSGTYCKSYNYMNDRPERGISVASIEWLNGTLYDVSSEHISRAGVYAIEGIELPFTGGDDEPLIIALNWGKRTGIKTYRGLERALKKL